MQHFCELKDVFPLEEFLEGWFLNQAPARAIPKGNIEEFVCFAFYNLKVEEVRSRQEQQHAVDEVIEKIQKW